MLKQAKCSGGISFFWHLYTGENPPFEYCCEEHDVFYEQGGTAQDRLFADKLFRDCMVTYTQKKDKPRSIAWVFYGAVRLFGWLYWHI